MNTAANVIREETREYKCPTCQAVIGREVVRNGQTLLDVGKGPVYRYHGYCACGAQIHWDARELIIKRKLQDNQ